MAQSVRAEANCKSSQPIYECLQSLTAQQLLNLNLDPTQSYWHPVPDGDFFNENISSTHSYALSQRLVELVASV